MQRSQPQHAPQPQTRLRRPFVYLNAATTADGKIAFANGRFTPFSSTYDRELLLQLRAGADAVMAGARTVDLSPVTMGPGGLKYRRRRVARGLAPYNLRVIVSGSASVDPQAEIFRHRFSPIVILTTGRAEPARLQRLRDAGAEIEICGERDLDFAWALHQLRHRWQVKRLLCEGGGEINGALLEAGLVDEICLTLCPLVFGGQQAPTLADGRGVTCLSDAVPLLLKQQRRIGDELYLIYRVKPGRRARRSLVR